MKNESIFKYERKENFKIITSHISTNKLFEYENDEFSNFRCLDLECNLIPEITLNYNDNTDDYKNKIQIVYKCEDNHKGIIPINDFLMNSSNYNIYKVVCAKNTNHQQKDKTSFIYCIECE